MAGLNTRRDETSIVAAGRQTCRNRYGQTGATDRAQPARNTRAPPEISAQSLRVSSK